MTEDAVDSLREGSAVAAGAVRKTGWEGKVTGLNSLGGTSWVFGVA